MFVKLAALSVLPARSGLRFHHPSARSGHRAYSARSGVAASGGRLPHRPVRRAVPDRRRMSSGSALAGGQSGPMRRAAKTPSEQAVRIQVGASGEASGLRLGHVSRTRDHRGTSRGPHRKACSVAHLGATPVERLGLGIASSRTSRSASIAIPSKTLASGRDLLRPATPRSAFPTVAFGAPRRGCLSWPR